MNLDELKKASAVGVLMRMCIAEVDPMIATLLIFAFQPSLQIFGKYLHLYPSGEETESARQKLDKQYRLTARLYESRFKESYGHVFGFSVWRDETRIRQN